MQRIARYTPSNEHPEAPPLGLCKWNQVFHLGVRSGASGCLKIKLYPTTMEVDQKNPQKERSLPELSDQHPLLEGGQITWTKLVGFPFWATEFTFHPSSKPGAFCVPRGCSCGSSREMSEFAWPRIGQRSAIRQRHASSPVL